MPSYAQRLRQRLEEIVALTERLLDLSGIEYDPDKVERMSRSVGMAIMVLVPDSQWAPLGEEARRRQRALLELWSSWIEHIRLMFSADSEEVRHQVEESAATVTLWLDRSGEDFSIPRTIGEAKLTFSEHVKPFFQLLAPFADNGDLVIVPDTNVLLRNQDLPSWGPSVGSEAFTVLLVPGVLAELDEQKTNHRNPDVREKARRFSDRIKGWRNQGSLTRGVRVQGEVYVRVAAREPDFGTTLSWLDRDVADDRILASILAFQRTDPRADVRLLSGDSIMLAKADDAGISTGDVPDREPIPP